MGVLEIPLVLEGKRVLVGGIHAVGTHPDHRGQGHYRRVMEEASGRDLSQFFRQWLYQGGKLQYEGRWSYDDGVVTVELNQVQNDGSLFEMPVQIGLSFEGEFPPQIEILQVDEARNTFTIRVEREPEDVVLDPDTWVLMEADFGRS